MWEKDYAPYLTSIFSPIEKAIKLEINEKQEWKRIWPNLIRKFYGRKKVSRGL